MKYLSLFSGIGGFELGIGDKAECIGYSEIDKYAIQIYEKHFNHKNYGNITTIQTKQLPDFDLLVGGFPCQSFSIAGKRKGFDDTRGTLFFDIARILADKRPEHLVLENVKGLLSHDGGKTFQTIIGVLTDLGYLVEWQVLNSKNFGVPQNRERVFIIGHLGKGSRPEVFPIGTDTGEITKSIKRKIIKSSARGFGASGSLVDKDDITPTLTQSMGTGGNNVPMILRGRPKYKDGKRGLKWYKYKDTCPAVTTNVASGDQKNIVIPQIRRLTPTECERLQGFPDGWTEGVSDTQRYKTLGNAVTVNVIKAIMERKTNNL